MNSLVIILVLVSFIGIQTNAEVSQKIMEHCKSQEQVADDEYERLKAHQLPESKNGQCYISCVMKEKKLLANDGSIDNDILKALGERMYSGSTEIIQKFVDVCSKETGSDHCEKAYNLMKCLMVKGTEMGLQPKKD